MHLQGLLPTKRDAYGRLILGDIITSINGKKVSNGTDLYRILDQCKVGEKVIPYFYYEIAHLYHWLTIHIDFRAYLQFSKLRPL